jgi:hypothetical protein
VSIIFVDVDGVLIPFTNQPGYQRFDFTHEGGQHSIQLNPSHGKWLTDLAAETGARLVWGSMWEHNAAKHIAPLVGLPDMPVMKIQRWKMSSTIEQDKAFSAINYAKGEFFVYLDDEFFIQHRLEQENANGVHIYVDPDIGLTTHHINLAKYCLLAQSVIIIEQ